MNRDLDRAENLLNAGMNQSSNAYSLLAIAKHLTKEEEITPKKFPAGFWHRDVCKDPTCNTDAHKVKEHVCDNTCDPVCNKKGSMV
jgi:hypothetical protein